MVSSGNAASSGLPETSPAECTPFSTMGLEYQTSFNAKITSISNQTLRENYISKGISAMAATILTWGYRERTKQVFVPFQRRWAVFAA